MRHVSVTHRERLHPRAASARARLRAALLVGLLAAGSARALVPEKALNQFPLRSWQTEDGLPQNTAQALAQTPDGYLWVGTYEGLARFDGVRFTVFDPMNTPALPDRSITALAVDQEGTLWINTHRGLAGLREGSFFRVSLPEHVIAREVHQLLPALGGGVWIATIGSGLMRLSEGRFQVWTSAQGLFSDRVLALAEARDGSLWVATPQGLQRWNGSAFLSGPAFSGPPPLVSALLVDAGGILWAGDLAGIVYRLQDGVMQPVPEASLPGNRISALLADRRGALWVASRGKGLLRLVEGRRSVLDGTNGLGRDTSLFCLLEDAEGSLWLGLANSGLFRLEDAPFTPYGLPEGMVYDPSHAPPSVALPPVLIEELWVDQQPLPVSEWSRIPPGERRVEIHYTTPALGAAERVRFRYKLEGIDADWVEAGTHRVAYYTRLPPGRHRFFVEATLPEGPAAQQAALVFHLQPRFFETGFFRVGLVLALGLAVAGGVWLRLHQSRQRERQLQARVDERTAELALRLEQLQATQHRLAHAEKLVAVGTLASGVGHEINNPLAYILSNLRYLSKGLRTLSKREEELERWKEVEEALADVLHGAERVRKIVQALKTLARVQTEPPRPVELHAVLDHALAVVEPQLSTRARIVRSYGLRQPVLGDEGRLGQVFLHLLANAAQAIPEGHPEHNEVRIRTLREADGRAVAEVSDTGHGIAPEILPRIFEPFFTTKEAGEGTGLGLSICHATIQSMGGEIQVESEPGRGATFRVLLPTAAG